jgi:hypothetical protein
MKLDADTQEMKSEPIVTGRVADPGCCIPDAGSLNFSFRIPDPTVHKVRDEK